MSDSPAESDPFDVQGFRQWEEGPFSKIVFGEIRAMANKRMLGIRACLHEGKTNEAVELNGELNALEEVLQIVDLLIEDQTQERKQKP